MWKQTRRMLTLLVLLDVAQSIKSSMRDAVITASACVSKRKFLVVTQSSVRVRVSSLIEDQEFTAVQ